MAIGIVYRAIKDAAEPDEERQRKAAALRKQGRFLEAERILDGFDRGLKIVFGNLGIKAGDWLSDQIFDEGFLRTEDDARFWYILNKTSQAEALLQEAWAQESIVRPGYISCAVSLANQALKAAILFPPFRDKQYSSLCRKLGTDPEYLESLAGYKLADTFGRLRSYAFVYEYSFNQLQGYMTDEYESWLALPDLEPEVKNRIEARLCVLRKEIELDAEISNMVKNILLPAPESSDGLLGWPWEIVRLETFQRDDFASFIFDIDVAEWGLPEYERVQQDIASDHKRITEETPDIPGFNEGMQEYYKARKALINTQSQLRELVPSLVPICGILPNE